MAKVYTYAVVLTGMMILLELGGINTGIHSILASLGLIINGFGSDTINLTASSLWNTLFNADTGLLIVAALTGIAIGYVTKSSSENYVILPFILTTGTALITTCASIINYSFAVSSPFMAYIILLIMFPLAIGYIISLVEFFKGAD